METENNEELKAARRDHGNAFQPGQSGNPSGRPRTRSLINALKAAVEQELPCGRTVEKAIAQTLGQEALHGKHRLAAINAIYDRIKGRPKQPIAVDEDKEARDRFARMTDEELDTELRRMLESHDSTAQQNDS